MIQTDPVSGGPTYNKQKREYRKRVHSEPQFWLNHLLSNLKVRARKKGLEFSLTKADIRVPDRCPVFGTTFVYDGGYNNPRTPSVDRIDNSRGYTPDNIQVISWRANCIKRDCSSDELRRVADFMDGK